MLALSYNLKTSNSRGVAKLTSQYPLERLYNFFEKFSPPGESCISCMMPGNRIARLFNKRFGYN